MSDLRPLRREDWSELRALLKSCSLPVEDLTEDQAPHFVGIFESDRLIALGGLELFEESALLRSLCVRLEAGQRGIAQTLVSELENRAREAGVQSVYLLTETAELFFQKRGYRRADRNAAPPSISASSQFSQVCPASAVFMVKSLA